MWVRPLSIHGTVARLVPALFLVVGISTCAIPAHSAVPLRERVSINADWRFHEGDPTGSALIYDVRPENAETAENRAADARPEEAEKVRTAAAALKPWILPTGNRFIGDPAKLFVRPTAEPSIEVPFAKADFNDSTWRVVNVPHDWAIEGPFLIEGNHGGMGRLRSWGPVWYRRNLEIPASDAGRRIFLDIDGAMSYAMVWLNGRLVGGWPYGYNSWRLDLTPHLKPGGDNQLAIRLDNPPASARWYPGSGLYRNVWLTKTHAIHVSQWGTFIRTPEVSTAAAKLVMDVVIDNDAAVTQQVSVGTAVHTLDAQGRKTGGPVARFAAAETSIGPNANARISGTTTLPHPRLWGPPPTQKPLRYVAVTTVRVSGKLVDSYETPFGIRQIAFDPDRGLLVNGQHIVIKGVNNHHDLGALGSAFNTRAAERQLELLREMGANAVRMSHNPPAPELLDLADRMGFLVIDEIFDSWERRKTPLDFHLLFPDWHEQDLRSMIRRDRNHPSVMLWSVGNEVGEQYTANEGAALARLLRDIAHEEDPTRPVTAAMNYAKPDMPFPEALDVISLNYQGEGIRDTPEFEGTDRIRTSPQYPAFHARFPDKAILSSETASAFSSRGVYLFPVTSETSAPVRDGRGGDSRLHQVSSYELHAVDFGASADKVFASLDRHPFVAGEFVWTGFDYLGEPTPYYTSRSSYSGIFDLAGFKKDRFYLYQSRWRPDLPMVHMLPHWTWPERIGQVTPIHVFTSGDEAELFLNGKSLGRRRKTGDEQRLRWDEVVYEPGEVRVIAYRAGKIWASSTMKTASQPSAIELTPDRREVAADGSDLVFITARVTDAAGITVPRADNRIRFNVEGPGEIIATDNGDPTSFDSFQLPERAAFNGYCLVIVRAKAGTKGKIVVRAQTSSLATAARIALKIRPQRHN